VKPARDWIALHGQSGEYPKVDEPIGCFTEAQVRQIQWDAATASREELSELSVVVSIDQTLAKVKKP
jgi:hypothetical protein